MPTVPSTSKKPRRGLLPELLPLVISHLDPRRPSDRQTLLVVLRSSSIGWKAVVPIVYHHVEVRDLAKFLRLPDGMQTFTGPPRLFRHDVHVGRLTTAQIRSFKRRYDAFCCIRTLKIHVFPTYRESIVFFEGGWWMQAAPKDIGFAQGGFVFSKLDSMEILETAWQPYNKPVSMFNGSAMLHQATPASPDFDVTFPEIGLLSLVADPAELTITMPDHLTVEGGTGTNEPSRLILEGKFSGFLRITSGRLRLAKMTPRLLMSITMNQCDPASVNVQMTSRPCTPHDQLQDALEMIPVYINLLLGKQSEWARAVAPMVPPQFVPSPAPKRSKECQWTICGAANGLVYKEKNTRQIIQLIIKVMCRQLQQMDLDNEVVKLDLADVRGVKDYSGVVAKYEGYRVYIRRMCFEESA